MFVGILDLLSLKGQAIFEGSMSVVSSSVTCVRARRDVRVK